jgi:MFS family permease
MDPATDRATAEEGVVIRPWSSLLIRDYALLWTGSLFSTTAAQMRQVVNLYQVYALSGSPIQLGLTGLFQAAPFIVFGLLGGTMADVMDRKKLIIITQAVALIPAFGLGILTATGSVQVWHIYGFTMLTSLVMAFGGPARMSIIPRLVPRSHLLNAVTLNTTTQQSTRLFGPVLAGFLIELLGLDSAYFTTGLLLIPSFVTVMFIRSSGMPQGPKVRLSVGSLVEGVRFIWIQRIILSLFLLDFGATLVGYYRPLLPIFAEDIYHVGASGLGWLYAAPALGAIVGSSALLLAGNVRRTGALAVVAALFFGGSLAFLGLSPWFWLTLVAVGALGLTDAISVTIRRTMVQLLAPDHMRGRASGLLSNFAMATNASGALLGGAAVALLGIHQAFLVGSLLCIGIVLGITLAMPQLWRYRSTYGRGDSEAKSLTQETTEI